MKDSACEGKIKVLIHSDAIKRSSKERQIIEKIHLYPADFSKIF